jgi:putative ABC transport system permease protein
VVNVAARFWLRWAGRDARRRAPQVVAIAAIIALGAGIYAGLGSTSVWRRASLDASFADLDAYDVDVSVPGGTAVPPDRLIDAVADAGGDLVEDVETRLVVHGPVTVEHESAVIPVAGEIVGTDLDGGRRINQWSIEAGRDLVPADAGEDVALLDLHFARQHDLPDTGEIRVGTRTVRYVGLALSPEYLDLTATSGEAIQGAATRAVVFSSIELAREVGEVAGVVEDGGTEAVNDAAVRAAPGVDPRSLARRLEEDLPAVLPEVAVVVTPRQDDPTVQALYDEIDAEQELFDVFALLVLAGAGFAAFNLVTRVMRAQRRDIGIAMSLGVPPRTIGIRPMLLAAQITVIGVILGVAVGMGIAAWVLAIMRAEVPLPRWETPFQWGLFARGALLGLIIPLAASALPVWRAVRVPPVEALAPPHLHAGGGLLPRLARRVRLPGTITLQAPLRRIIRSPARSALTVVAVAFIIAPLLAALGATDSMSQTIRAGEQALEGEAEDRLIVDLAAFQPATAEVVETVEASPLVDRAAVGLNTGGFLVDPDGDAAGEEEFGVSLTLLDLEDPLAAPPGLAEDDIAPGGIVLSDKAADDLEVGVGDLVTLRHPRREAVGFRFVTTELPVSGVHDSPYRFVGYMDIRDAGIMGLEGIINTLRVAPAEGVSLADLQNEMAGVPGVASALSVTDLSRTMRDMLATIDQLFLVLQAVIAALAFLVAFNASNIGADERVREHATMMAFGVRIPRILGMAVGESLILGAIGVGLGLGFGNAVLEWILATVFPAAIPDIAVVAAIHPLSYTVTVLLGVAATALAPLLNRRRLRRTDIPSTLRFVE